MMSEPLSRRTLCKLTAGAALGSVSGLALAQDVPKPVEALFERDYPAPDFKPAWKKPQLNRTMVQDFVLYAHSDLDMTRKLLDKEPMLINAIMDWGAGDWESALGGASHMARRDIVELLLERGARIDIFCATMMGQFEAVKSFLTLQPKLIDSRGPHGFHAALPRAARRQGCRPDGGVPAVDQEDRAEAKSIR
jgi:hypothetical protein